MGSATRDRSSHIPCQVLDLNGVSMVVKRSEWKSILAMTSLCTALLGSVNAAVRANPLLVAQSATGRTPQTVTGRLDQNSAVLEDSGRYYETHTFEGKAGEPLTIELTSDDFDAYLILLSPTEEIIAENDDGAGGTNAGIVITLPIKGTYTIVANTYQVGAIGDYQLAWRGATTIDQELALATELNHQAVELYQTGHYAEAEPLLKRSLDIREAQLGPDHPDTAQSLNNLAALYELIGRYDDAEALFQRSLDIKEEQLGPEHPDTATSLNNLAGLYESVGRYAEAEPLYQQALAILEARLGPQHPVTATSLNNLALLYRLMGRYADAEPLYQRSLVIFETQLGPQHPVTATSLNNLALLYRLMGRYADAEPLYQRSLDIRETQLGSRHTSTADSLNNLAALYSSMGHYADAEPLFQQSLDIYEAQLGPQHPSTARNLNNLAALYRSMGRYTEAEPLFQRSLDIYESQLGPQHPVTATNLNNLAALYRSMGRYAESESLLQRSLAIRETKLGPDHPDTAISLNNLSELFWVQGQLQPAFNYLQRGLTVEETVLNRNLVMGSDENKRDYMTTVSDTTNAAVSLYLNELSTNPKAAQLALTTILQRKGRILDLFTNLRDQLADDTMAIELLNDLTSTSTQLSNLTDNPAPDLLPEDYAAKLNRLQVQIDTLEGQLSQRSAEFAELTNSPSLADIQASLPNGTALVEFIRYQPYNPGAPSEERYGPHNYAAFLLLPDGTIQGMDLGPAEVIDTVVSTLADSLASPNTPKFQIKEEAKTLEALVVAPVRQALGDTTTVFLSPDGALNLIPFEALVDENNNYLVERYQFRYLTSGRDLMRLANTNASDNPVVLMGDPTFGWTKETPVSQAKDSTRREINLEENVFPPLAGTRLEVEGIAQQFPDAQVYLTTTATEAQLKTAQQPSILHLATHGFFRTTEETLNPLLQSGLVLAGVAERQSGPAENGVLTALEVTSLKLRGTQLVVLSACETGLGELSVSEGLYGLRRALVLAGSQSQVMSLWKVDDTATQELMVAYYEKLRDGTPRDQALTATQRAFLQDPEYDHPYYWAAFIGSGDWRPLQ